MRQYLPATAAAVLLLSVAASTLPAQVPPYDLIIGNARVVDGTGSPWYRADIAVRGDTIAAIARRIDGPAGRVIDAGGLIVAPGFVDLHVHAFGDAGALPPAVLPIEEVPPPTTTSVRG